MNTRPCHRAEVIAGAIALDEATDAERAEYRKHIASCRSCLDALGGEREIERVVSVIHQARSEETWEPVVASYRKRQQRSRMRLLRFGFSAVVVAVAASIGIHVLVAASLGPAAETHNTPVAVSYNPMHVTLEQRPAAKPQQHAAAPKVKVEEPRLIVVHNVINLKSPAVMPVAVPHTVAKQPVAKPSSSVVASAATPAPAAAPATGASNVPIWRRNGALPKQTVNSYSVASNTPPLEQHAEYMSVAPSNTVRDVMPIGGETAINPRPAPIAYEEGADGTSVFEVSVDDRGTPTKCTITKSSGFLVLDDAVCRAAMKARYQPRLVNGRPTTGVYRDAFTFHMSNDTDTLPSPGPQ